MAVIIVLVISEVASGVKAPRASRAPPAVSAAPAGHRVAPRRPQLELVHHLTRPVESRASEPAEQLLRAVADEKPPDRHARD
jgi:hypothetical protein